MNISRKKEIIDVYMKELVKYAKRKNNEVEYAKIEEKFADIKLTSEDADYIYDEFVNRGIAIIVKSDLSEEEQVEAQIDVYVAELVRYSKRNNGRLAYDKIEEKFLNMNLTLEDLEYIYDKIESKGIEIIATFN